MAELRFTPFPALTTERLILRRIEHDDALAIQTIRSNDIVNKHLKKRPKEMTFSEAQEFITNRDENLANNYSIVWGICYRDNPELIGTICLWNFSEDKLTTEVGYELLSEHHGKKIMDEALKCVIDYGINTIGVTTIEAFTSKYNTSSMQLLNNNKFVLDPGRRDEDNEDNTIFVLRID